MENNNVEGENTSSIHVENKKKEVFYGKPNMVWKAVGIVAILLFIAALFVGPVFSFGDISKDEAESKTVEFVNSLLAGQAVADVKDVSKEYGLYKISMNIQGELVEAYLSPDGKYFFAQPIDLDLFNELYENASKNETNNLDEDLVDIEGFPDDVEDEGIDIE